MNRKFLSAALILTIVLTALICAARPDSPTESLAISIQTRRANCLLTITSDGQPLLVRVDGEQGSWRRSEHGFVQLTLPAPGVYAVAIESKGTLHWRLTGGTLLQTFNKNTLNTRANRAIIDELNSGGPLPPAGHERPCEEGEQSHE